MTRPPIAAIRARAENRDWTSFDDIPALCDAYESLERLVGEYGLRHKYDCMWMTRGPKIGRCTCNLEARLRELGLEQR